MYVIRNSWKFNETLNFVYHIARTKVWQEKSVAKM